MPNFRSNRSRNTTPSNPIAGCSTIREARIAASQLLKAAGLESPEYTADVLLCHALGCDRLSLLLNGNQPIAVAARRRLHRLLQRRLQREPLQYLVRQTDFYTLRLHIRRGVFIPRPETELVVEEALSLLRTVPFPLPLRILDIGTGSGCIALALASSLPEAHVVGIDISVAALRLARENARRLGLRNVSFSHVDILRQLPPAYPFHLVVSNPPYIPASALPQLQPEITLYEPHEALTDGADGLSFYRRFADLFPTILVPGGAFVLEIRPESASAITTLFRPLASMLYLQKDYTGTERVLVGILAHSPTTYPPSVH